MRANPALQCGNTPIGEWGMESYTAAFRRSLPRRHKNKNGNTRRARRLFIIKGGRSTFARLVFAKNLSNGSNADVPNRFYPRDSWAGGPGCQTNKGYSCMGAAAYAARLLALRRQSSAHQGDSSTHAQAHATGQ